MASAGPNLKHVFVSPCHASKDTFSACAICIKYGVHFTHYFQESCLSECYRVGEEVDLTEELKKLRQKYSCLYTRFGAQDIKDVPGSFTLQACVPRGRNSAMTVDAHFLPNGKVLTFDPNLYCGSGQAVLLQRTSFRGAKTFDAEILNGEAKSSFEMRLVKNCHLSDLQKWGTENNMVVFRSSELVSSNLLFRAYDESLADGKTPEEAWVVIAKALTGEDSEEEDEPQGSDVDEWVPDGSESDESMDSCEEDEEEEDLLECLRD